MDRHQIRSLANMLVDLAAAADRVALAIGIEPTFNFGGAFVAPITIPTPAVSGDAAGEDRDGWAATRPAVAEKIGLTDRELRDKIISAPQSKTSANNGEPWTEAEDVVLRDMLRDNSGMSYNGLAEKIRRQSGMQRTRDAIAYRLKNKTRDQIAANGDVNHSAGVGKMVERDPVNQIVTVEHVPEVAAANLPMWHKALRAELKDIGYAHGWDAELDYDLASAIVRGDKLPAIALDLGRDGAECMARWKLLKTAAQNDRGEFKLEEQGRLIEVLRARAMEKRAVAA
jgi:hypothetical protein